jgi:hypothetical protein
MGKRKDRSIRLITFDQETLQNCCGVDEVGNFDVEEAVFEWDDEDKVWMTKDYYPRFDNCYDDEELDDLKSCAGIDKLTKPGTGMFICTFIDTEDQRTAYKAICKRHKRLTQTKPFRNGEYGNHVFQATFLWQPKPPKKEKAPSKRRAGEYLPSF